MSRTKTRTSGFGVATAAFLLGWLVGVPASFGYVGPRPLIFDWTSAPEYYGTSLSPNMDSIGFQTIHTKCTPVPYPGTFHVWDNPPTLQMYDRLMLENRPVSMMLNGESRPLTGSRANSLPDSMNYLSGKHYRLDYVWMDYEGQGDADTAEVAEVVRQVRAHADPQINQARIGQYGFTPCSSLATMPWPFQNSPEAIAAADNAYHSTGVNVAMPSCYPFEVYGNHTYADPTYGFGSNVAPNKRSALFWGPLEVFSNAKINLPVGHQIIPWVNDFVPSSDPYYHSPQPTHEDNAALLKHLRLRGADGYYALQTLSENEAVPYPNEQYRGDMIAAWSSLDWLFAGGQTPTLLNLATNKTSGLQWSGGVTDNGVVVLVSNLGNSTAWFNMPDVGEFNDKVIDGFYIGAGEHRLEMFQVPEPTMITLLLSGAGAWLLRRRRTSRRMPLS